MSDTIEGRTLLELGLICKDVANIIDYYVQKYNKREHYFKYRDTLRKIRDRREIINAEISYKACPLYDKTEHEYYSLLLQQYGHVFPAHQYAYDIEISRTFVFDPDDNDY